MISPVCLSAAGLFFNPWPVPLTHGLSLLAAVVKRRWPDRPFNNVILSLSKNVILSLSKNVLSPAHAYPYLAHTNP
jgi:hypothetical protein